MKRALYLTGDDWFALYVDGKSVAQSHRLQPMELLELAEKHQFSYADVADHWANEADENECVEVGNFPELQSDLKGNYA